MLVKGRGETGRIIAAIKDMEWREKESQEGNNKVTKRNKEERGDNGVAGEETRPSSKDPRTANKGKGT